jgi:uncharacterized RDD family membrane protein YckC
MDSDIVPRSVCASCGNSLSPQAKFCSHCGTLLTRFCQSCGANLQGSTSACPSCGVPVWQQPPVPSRSTAAPSLPPDRRRLTPPAATPFEAPLAGWWQRVGASILDGIILVPGTAIVIPPLIYPEIFVVAVTSCHGEGRHFQCHVTSSGPIGWIVALDIAVVLLCWLAYFGVFNGLVDGQTPADAAAGISVRDANTGTLVGFWRGAARWLIRSALYACLIVPGLVNDLWPLWDKRSQSFADKACKTVVIRTR